MYPFFTNVTSWIYLTYLTSDLFNYDIHYSMGFSFQNVIYNLLFPTKVVIFFSHTFLKSLFSHVGCNWCLYTCIFSGHVQCKIKSFYNQFRIALLLIVASIMGLLKSANHFPQSPWVPQWVLIVNSTRWRIPRELLDWRGNYIHLWIDQLKVVLGDGSLKRGESSACAPEVYTGDLPRCCFWPARSK